MSSKGISWLCLSSLLRGVSMMPAAQPQRRRMPDSPTGRMAGAFVELADAPDESAVETFLDTRVTPSASDAMAPRLRDYRDTLEAPELDRAEKTGAFSAVLTLTSNGTTHRVSYEVESEEPHQLASFSFEADSAGRSAALPPVEGGKDVPPSEVTKGYFEKLAEVDAFSGSVLVARGDALLYEAAFGLAERASNRPNQTDTLFDVGSIRKLMTKVAIGQLARDGKLSLDDTIAAHLPDYPNSKVASSVTIDQLVHHRSGLGDIFNEKFQRTSKASLLTPRDFFPIFVDDPLDFVPGSSQRYSNAGYIVLGAIVEAASGQDYVSYIEENVFAPAGMTESRLHHAGRLTPRFGDRLYAWPRRSFERAREQSWDAPDSWLPSGKQLPQRERPVAFRARASEREALGREVGDLVFRRRRQGHRLRRRWTGCERHA